MGRSRKENERRLPIHPLHLHRVPDRLRSRIVLERGYGEPFGMPDDDLARWVAAVLPRERVLAGSDVVLQPKPTLSDVEEMRAGQVLWGWPHCVQDPELTQLAIDRRLTVIAFEAMHHWTRDGAFSLHVFHANNELAGYCSVLHALTLAGQTGTYGRRLSAAVLGFGATARGAVTALTALGVLDVDVLTHREVAAVAAPIHSARIVHLEGPAGPDDDGQAGHEGHTVLLGGGPVPLAEFLARHDVVVNCVLQDTADPKIWLTDADLDAFAPGSVVVDVSCDRGMGFSWAQPTTFGDPTFVVGDGVLYYAVDHSPSYLWNSATWENSEALLPFLQAVMDGPDAWAASPTLSRAVEIEDGVVRNPAVLAFQGRDAAYPHEVVRPAPGGLRRAR